MVVPKKNGKLHSCIEFLKLNVTTKKDQCPFPFMVEVLNMVVRYEVYLVLDEYFGYH